MTRTETIVGTAVPNLPWEDKPPGCRDVVWRYSGNPIMGRNPVGRAARIFNSAAIACGGEFVGVFRVDHRNERPDLHFRRSPDGIHWDIDPDAIAWCDAAGRPVSRPGDSGHTPFGDIVLSWSPDLTC